MFINNEKQHFAAISQFAGERYDLIQAGGGNSSVKLKEDKMIIKASGQLLSGVDEDNGYVIVDRSKVLAILEDSLIITGESKRAREDHAAKLMKDSIVQPDYVNRPSIETFLHATLFKYILHTHPIAVNMLTCQKDWKEQLKDLFPDALLVNYKTPGIDLAIELKKECDHYKKLMGMLPKIIFLQNHGLIISSDDPKEIIALTNKVVDEIENALEINLYRYKLTNELTIIMRECVNEKVISYLSEDYYLTRELLCNSELLHQPNVCPDTLVFCGFHAIDLAGKNESYKINEYYDLYHTTPKVVLYKGYLFFISNSLKKAKETEEVFKAHIMTIKQIVGYENRLPAEELRYLDNWEAEKYRQGI